jgi:hypothetical protein
VAYVDWRSTRWFIVSDPWNAKRLGARRKRAMNARLQCANFGLKLNQLVAIDDWLRLHKLCSLKKRTMALVPRVVASPLHWMSATYEIGRKREFVRLSPVHFNSGPLRDLFWS